MAYSVLLQLAGVGRAVSASLGCSPELQLSLFNITWVSSFTHGMLWMLYRISCPCSTEYLSGSSQNMCPAGAEFELGLTKDHIQISFR